jgi:preprotein translocase subunit SecE
MAEVRSKEKKVKKSTPVKKTEKKEEKSTKKKGVIARIRIFFHGVASEFKKVHWPTKENMLKYSIATIFFIIFCGAFFYLIDVIFALIRSLF